MVYFYDWSNYVRKGVDMHTSVIPPKLQAVAWLHSNSSNMYFHAFNPVGFITIVLDLWYLLYNI